MRRALPALMMVAACGGPTPDPFCYEDPFGRAVLLCPEELTIHCPDGVAFPPASSHPSICAASVHFAEPVVPGSPRSCPPEEEVLTNCFCSEDGCPPIIR